MQQYKKQKPNQNKLTLISVIGLSLFLLATIQYVITERRITNMHLYAIENNCKWQYNGSLYTDDRDYTCK